VRGTIRENAPRPADRRGEMARPNLSCAQIVTLWPGWSRLAIAVGSRSGGGQRWRGVVAGPVLRI